MYVPMCSFPVSCVQKHSVSLKPAAASTRKSAAPQASSYRVHLSQDGPVGEEQRLPGVHHDQVEKRAPGVFLTAGL